MLLFSSTISNEFKSMGLDIFKITELNNKEYVGKNLVTKKTHPEYIFDELKEKNFKLGIIYFKNNFDKKIITKDFNEFKKYLIKIPKIKYQVLISVVFYSDNTKIYTQTFIPDNNCKMCELIKGQPAIKTQGILYTIQKEKK